MPTLAGRAVRGWCARAGPAARGCGAVALRALAPWTALARRALGPGTALARRVLRPGTALARRALARHPRLAFCLTVGRRTVSEVGEDRILRLAAETAFWALLSLAPLVLALLGLAGYVGEGLGQGAVGRIHDDVLRVAGRVLTPQAVHTVVAPLVDRVLGQSHPDVASAGFVISLWSGSAAMNAYVGAITVAYDMDGLRPAWRTRAIALGLYVGIVVVGAVLLPLLVLGPGTITRLAPGAVTPEVSTFVHVAYWPVVGLGSLAVLATLYWLAVPVRAPWLRGLPGAVLAMAVWLAGSFGIRFYLTSGLRRTSTYGPLGAPIAALLFFYVTALAVLVGAELNSELDEMAPHPATLEGRRRARAARQAREAWVAAEAGGAPAGG
ncbi:MAG: YihY/virulence factor BrkB family protein, partial [Acidimicrobiales bacterium]